MVNNAAPSGSWLPVSHAPVRGLPLSAAL